MYCQVIPIWRCQGACIFQNIHVLINCKFYAIMYHAIRMTSTLSKKKKLLVRSLIGEGQLQPLSSFPSVIVTNDNESRRFILAPIRQRQPTKALSRKTLELVAYLLLLLNHRETVNCQFGEIGCPLLREYPLSGACTEHRTLNSTRKKGRSWAHFFGAYDRSKGIAPMPKTFSASCRI